MSVEIRHWSKTLEWNLIEVELTSVFVILVRFKDGVESVFKFLPTFFRGVFTHLRDKSQFQQVMVVDGAFIWSGELDLAPDAMHGDGELKRSGQWQLA